MENILKFSKFLIFISCLNSYAQISFSKIKPYSDTLRNQIETLKFDKAKATVHFLDSLAQKSLNDSIKGFVFKLKGNYYYRISDFEKAMTNFIEAAKRYENIKDSIEVSKIYNNVSLILNAAKEHKKSLNLKKKALQFCPKNNDTWKTTLFQNIASTYRDLNELDSSYYYLNLSYKYAKKNNSKYHIGSYHFSKALNFLENKDYENTIKHLDTLNKFYAKNVSRPMYENGIYYEALTLFKLGKYNKALLKAKLSLEMVLKSGMTVNVSESYELLSSIYESLNDYKNSLKALQSANIYRDSIFTLDKNKAVLELEQKYQTEKKEKENLTLIQQTSEKDLTIAKKNNYLLFGSLLFITIILSLILYQLRKFKIKNSDLQNSINEREKIEKELEIVRDSIAKDFHDDLGNKLARITVLSEYMIQSVKNWNKSKIIEALKKINLDADILYKGTRDFMFSLKSKSDYTEELFTYLSDFGEEFFQSFNIDFYVEKKLDFNKKLPYYWNRQIIMIFKEAMTNAAKHSHSTEVKLTMKIKKNDLFIIFEDNGIGFNFEKISSKNGLSNMQLRAEKMNVLFKISSSKKGTKISFNAKIPN